MVEIDEVPADDDAPKDASTPNDDEVAEGWEKLMGDDLIMTVRILVR